jgi:hypothetical protein
VAEAAHEVAPDSISERRSCHLGQEAILNSPHYERLFRCNCAFYLILPQVNEKQNRQQPLQYSQTETAQVDNLELPKRKKNPNPG